MKDFFYIRENWTVVNYVIANGYIMITGRNLFFIRNYPSVCKHPNMKQPDFPGVLITKLNYFLLEEKKWIIAMQKYIYTEIILKILSKLLVLFCILPLFLSPTFTAGCR
jgi:hypothetical protein